MSNPDEIEMDEGWINDAESIIHQHYGSDGSDDAHNDWVHDLASELWSHFGAGNAAASGIDALDVLDEHITRLIEAGDALYDRIAPATNTTDATQLDVFSRDVGVTDRGRATAGPDGQAEAR